MVFERLGIHVSIQDTQILGECITLPFSGKVAKSRFLKAALTERMSSWDQNDHCKRGIPSERLIRLFEEWGRGGYGMIVTGNVMLHPQQLEAPGNSVLYAPYETSQRLEQFQKIASAAKANGSLVIMQIMHPGRQIPDFINPTPVSAGDIKLNDCWGMSFGKPTPLTKDEIKEIVAQFVYATEVAYRTGYDGVQLNAAHGFLISQFLSRTTNNRIDEYGGSIKNRSRIIREILDGIREKVTDSSFIMGIKINSVEFQEKGFQPEEAAELCEELEAIKMDFVEISGGTYDRLMFHHDDSVPRESSIKREAFFAQFAKKLAPSLTRSVPYLTGGFRTATGMVEAVRSGNCAGIGIGRPACSDPYLASQIISGEVTGSTRVKLPANDFGILSMAAGAQMEAIGRGESVFDLSHPKVLEWFGKVIGEYQQTTKENTRRGIIQPGWPVLNGHNLIEY